MTGLRILALAIGLMLMIPMIAISVWGFDTSQWDDSAVARNDTILTDAEVIPEAASIPPDQAGRRHDQAALRDTFSQNALNANHMVIVEQIVDITELLNRGENPPEPAFLELYAAARAPAQLIRYCGDVLDAIGTSCDLLHSEVHQNRHGKLVLTGHLGFQPAASSGDPSTVTGGALIAGSVELPYDGDLRPANESASRVAAMQQAQAMCDKLRETYGNCVLTRVIFDIEELWITDMEVLPAGTNPQRLRTSATFKIYANETTLDHQGLLNKLHEMTGQS